MLCKKTSFINHPDHSLSDIIWLTQHAPQPNSVLFT